MSVKIRIKDIALRSGVSAGTVDRVLHGRGGVSAPARERVEAAMREMDFTPNMYASALAYNRHYHFVLLMPRYDSEAYWEEIEKGAREAAEGRREFSVELTVMYYDRLSPGAFAEACGQCLRQRPDGVVMVPGTEADTRGMAVSLHREEIPFVSLDSYMPETQPLSFFGQDSRSSGRFAARMLMMDAGEAREVTLLRLTTGGRLVSRQQEEREAGFLDYMRRHHPATRVSALQLAPRESDETYDLQIGAHLDAHPESDYCLTFCSRAYLLGEWALRHGRPLRVLGYDMVRRNVECLAQGAIRFIIAQHAFVQGYAATEALFGHVVLGRDVPPVNHMAIELVTQENMDFYHRKLY